MSSQPPPPADAVRPPAHTDGLSYHPQDWLEDQSEKRVDEIEMIGEEEAAGLGAGPRSHIGPNVRYLHASRTIHQLVTDRNRAVGLYIAVASLLWTASSALLNAKPTGKLLIPIETVQRWCLPATFGTLCVLALFVGFMLIRTRVGLIYEVAKMNVLLGLPAGRVKRVNVFSLFFLMHLLVSVAGGASGSLFLGHILYDPDADRHVGTIALAVLCGVAVVALLIFSYVGTVLHTTTDTKLQNTGP